jgi:hypothetical protein
MVSVEETREIVNRYLRLRAKFESRVVTAGDFLDLGIVYLSKCNDEPIVAAKEILFRQAILYLAVAHQIAPGDANIASFLAKLLIERGNLALAMRVVVPALEAGRGQASLQEVKRVFEQVSPSEFEALRKDPKPAFSFLTSFDLTAGEFFILFFGIFSEDAIDYVPTYRSVNFGGHVAIDPNALATELNAKSLDGILNFLAVDLSPDAVFYSISSITEVHRNLRPETLALIREKTRTQIVLIGYDVAKTHYGRIVATLAPYADILHLLDWSLDDKLTDEVQDRVIFGFAPVDDATFFCDDRPRDIDISFVGRTTGHYAYRGLLIDRLRDAGLGVEVAGGDSLKTSKTEYADLFRRSKITLNLSWSRVAGGIDTHPILESSPFVSHLKLRVLEAIKCGALLFEDRNPCTSAVLSPGQQYVEYTFDTVADLAQHYLANDSKRTKIAAAGRSQVEELFSAKAYWEKIRGRLLAGRSAWRPGTTRRAYIASEYSTIVRDVSQALD